MSKTAAPDPGTLDPAAAKQRPVVLLLGPHREAVSGVSTHLNLLFASRLAECCTLLHFQVGSEGRDEGPAARLMRFLFSPLLLLAAIIRHRVEVVHINSGLTARGYWRDLAYLLVSKLCAARVVYQVHGGALPQQFFDGKRIPTAFLRWSLQWPDAIVVLANEALEAYRRFVPGQQVLALPNAIDCAPYAGLPNKAPDPAQPLRIAYIGRLAEGKGLHETLRALKHARAQGVRTRLTIAGSGTEETHLRRIVQELDLGGEVSFAGPVFGAAKLRLLADTDVFLLASHAEGLPYALLEAMAAGVPPIVTRVGAIPDVVVEGVHGLFVPARDPVAISNAIATLAADRKLLGRMGVACRKRIISGYSITRVEDGLGSLYSGLCGAGRVAALNRS